VQLTLAEGLSLVGGILSVSPHIVSCNIPGLCDSAHTKSKETVPQPHSWTAQPSLHGGWDLSLRDAEVEQASPALTKEAARLQDGPHMHMAADALVLRRSLGPSASASILRKLPRWHVPFWDAVIAPAMACSSMLVESWIHGPERMKDGCNPTAGTCIVNGAGATFSASGWHIMQDHSKWALCCNKGILCFGDMNREDAQQFRGGLALCLESHGRIANVGDLLYEWLQRHANRRQGACRSCPCYRNQGVRVQALT
jgi:Deoxyribonuclease II